MSYISNIEEGLLDGGLGCGPSCKCGPCKSGLNGLNERYEREEAREANSQAVPRLPTPAPRLQSLGSQSQVNGWRLGSYLGEPPPADQRTRPVAQAPGTGQRVSSTMRPVTDTFKPPFRWVCRVEVITETKNKKSHSFGTGVLISPYHVLTCAHLIYPPREPYRTVKVVVSPGYNPNSKPVTWARQPAFNADGWAVDPRWDPRQCLTSTYFDWGLIRMSKPVGSYDGARQVKPGQYVSVDNWRNWLPLSLAPSLPGKPCKLAGYSTNQMFESDGRLGPGVKITVCRPEETSPSGGIIRSHTEGVPVSVTGSSILITHDADSTEAMSGGPIWIDDGGSPKLVAIHTGVTSTAASGATGLGKGKGAVLLSQAVQDQILRLMTGFLRPFPPPFPLNHFL